MKIGMNRWERVRAALAGQAVDRVPVSMWRHFYSQETSAETLAGAMLGFQARYDWDFMKVNPRASYHVEDWGVKVKYGGDSPPAVTGIPIRSADDWLAVKVLDVTRGVLGEQLASLEIIARELKGEVPFIMTVFTPLSIAGRLAGTDEAFLNHLRGHYSQVSHALEVITETFTRFATACLERGATGLFYATTNWATADRLSAEEYRKYARPYDLKLLGALPRAEFHVLHVCKKDNLLKELADYPVHAFSWDARGAGNLSLAEGRIVLGGKTVIGGVAHDSRLVHASPAGLVAEIDGMRVAMGTKGWIIGPGCTFLPDTPEANLAAVREAVG